MILLLNIRIITDMMKYNPIICLVFVTASHTHTPNLLIQLIFGYVINYERSKLNRIPWLSVDRHLHILPPVDFLVLFCGGPINILCTQKRILKSRLFYCVSPYMAGYWIFIWHFAHKKTLIKVNRPKGR
jgi:hypothetical protein